MQIDSEDKAEVTLRDVAAYIFEEAYESNFKSGLYEAKPLTKFRDNYPKYIFDMETTIETSLNIST